MESFKHIVMIAGEESGDLHAAALIKQLKTVYPHMKISGIGGQHMAQAGAELVYDLACYGVTGFTEVLRYLKIIRRAFLAIKNHLNKEPPDLLILIDYPGFNLRLARYAKQKLGLKILYYISPQIWAWKAQRIHLIKACVDHMAVILPFEKKIYEQAGVPVSFVGHPLVDTIAALGSSLTTGADLNLPSDKKIIALLPGSRSHEIEKHMPVLADTAKRLQHYDSNFHFVIPVAKTIAFEKMAGYFSKAFASKSVSIVVGKALDCMALADVVIVASGTASLECALLEKPMCIIYKSSFFTYLAASVLIKVKFLGLCNLLVNKMMVPEFLQYDCNSVELYRYIVRLDQNPAISEHMVQQLIVMRESLSNKKSDCSLLDLVVNQLS